MGGAVLGLIAVGCGGSGGGGNSGPSTHKIIRSTALSTYQTVAALSAFPIEALEAAAPMGSDITAIPSTTTGTLSIVHHTGLYSKGAQSNSMGAIFDYYSDSAGTQSAGSMTLTSSTKSFTYAHYPATVQVAMNVTEGNIPCQGTATITFQNASGAGTLIGKFNLARNQEAVTFSLGLDSSHNVTGTLQIVENGITISETHLNGPLIGSQSLDFAISPSGFNGTGTIDLLSPTINLIFDNPSGASASIDTNHHMTIHYGQDGGGGSDDDIATPIIELLFDDGTDVGDDSGSTSGETGSTTSGDTGSTTTDGSTSGDTGDDGSCDAIAAKKAASLRR